MGDYERKAKSKRARRQTADTGIAATPGKRTNAPGVDGEAAWNGEPYRGSVFDGASVPWPGDLDGGTDLRLVPEARSIEFSRTVVGSRSTRDVAFVNEDTRALALDELIPMAFDPFKQFRVQQASTLVLQPGERRAIPVEFVPARAGRSEQHFQAVSASGPLSPDADIHVGGEGIDVLYTPASSSRERAQEASSSPLATEMRLEEQTRERLASVRPNDPLVGQRAAAAEEVRRWEQRAMRFTNSAAEWTLINWLHFLGKTGGDHSLHGTAQVVDVWKKGVYAGLKKGAGAGADALLAVAKQSVRVALFLEYPLFGLAISQAVDKLSDFLLDQIGLKPEKPEDESDRHALAATKSTARAGVKKTVEVFAYQEQANLVIRDTSSTAQLQIARCQNADELDVWKRWAQLEAVALGVKAKTELSFANQLLKQWVLEHAATPTTPNNATNPRAWSAARDELQKNGALTTVERTDLFVHQCRQEWGSLGLADYEVHAAHLDAQRREFETLAAAGGIAQADLAPSVSTQLNASLVTFRRSTDPRRTVRELAPLQYQLATDRGLDGLSVLSSDFILDCRIWLTHDGKGVRVKRFTYDLQTSRGSRAWTGLTRSPGKSP